MCLVNSNVLQFGGAWVVIRPRLWEPRTREGSNPPGTSRTTLLVHPIPTGWDDLCRRHAVLLAPIALSLLGQFTLMLRSCCAYVLSVCALVNRGHPMCPGFSSLLFQFPNTCYHVFHNTVILQTQISMQVCYLVSIYFVCLNNKCFQLFCCGQFQLHRLRYGLTYFTGDNFLPGHLWNSLFKFPQ